jgi:hypothetical protein
MERAEGFRRRKFEQFAALPLVQTTITNGEWLGGSQ